MRLSFSRLRPTTCNLSLEMSLDLTVNVKKSTPGLTIELYLFDNKPYSTTRRKNSGTGRTKLTALTAALRNRKMKMKVVTTSTSK